MVTRTGETGMFWTDLSKAGLIERAVLARLHGIVIMVPRTGRLLPNASMPSYGFRKRVYAKTVSSLQWGAMEGLLPFDSLVNVEAGWAQIILSVEQANDVRSTSNL